MTTIRAVLAGCGGISSVWLDALKGFPDVTLAGLVDIHPSAAQAQKEKYGLTDARIGSDLRAMLKTTKADVVFDLTTPGARSALVMTALRHGCHVLSEKPMAASMAEARRLMQAALKAKRLFAVMQNRRYDSRIRAFHNLIAGDHIGHLTTLNSDFYIGAHFGGFRDSMRHVLLLDMAIHSFDQARFISGTDPVAVYCREWNPKGSWFSHDASAIAIFEMSDHIVYTYRGSWCAEGLNTTWECDWRAVATRGSATWNGADAIRAQVAEHSGGFRSQMSDIPVLIPESIKQSGHAQCIRAFLDSVMTGRAPETVCTDNIKSLAMVFGAIKSASTGKRIRISI